MKRLVLIDGNAILHRAYYALPISLALEDKTPVNAVYGFTAMLLRVIQDLKPTYVICAFDLPKPTFRDKLYPAYRAQRPPTPEKLVQQVALVKEVVRAFGIPIYEVEGYEADDVIGTLARQAKNFKIKNAKLKIKNKDRESAKRNNNLAREQWNPELRRVDYRAGDETIETIIVTGDRDLLQLVGRRIKVYLPVKGLSQAKLHGEEEVRAKFGVRPAQLVDYKALVGDPSDNYPGVKGIGPKTAQRLISKFATLENIYKSLQKKHPRSLVNFLQEKTISALKKYKQDALMAKKLAKITTDVPIELDLEAAKLNRFDTLDVKALFDKLSFRTLWRRVKGSQRFPHQNKFGAGQASVKGQNYKSKLKNASGKLKAKNSAENKKQEKAGQLTML